VTREGYIKAFDPAVLAAMSEDESGFWTWLANAHQLLTG